MDFGRLGIPELLLILALVILLFGPGRIGKVAGEMGKGIRAFRDGLSGKDETKEKKTDENPPDSPKDDA